MTHPLQLQLKYVSLAQNPRYHALSYTWQSDFQAEQGFVAHQDSGVDITVDGQQLKITSNLAAALAIIRNWSTFTSL